MKHPVPRSPQRSRHQVPSPSDHLPRRGPLLIITRRPGEKIKLGDEVVLEVIEVSGSSVRVGIAAPKSVPVYREEIWRAVKDENAAAAAVERDQRKP